MLLLTAEEEEEEEEEEEVARLVALEAAAVAVEVESAAGDDGAFAEYRNFTASCTTYTSPVALSSKMASRPAS